MEIEESSPLGNVQKPSGYGPRQFAPGESAWALGMDYVTLEGPFHSQVFHDSGIQQSIEVFTQKENKKPHT